MDIVLILYLFCISFFLYLFKPWLCFWLINGTVWKISSKQQAPGETALSRYGSTGLLPSVHSLLNIENCLFVSLFVFKLIYYVFLVNTWMSGSFYESLICTLDFLISVKRWVNILVVYLCMYHMWEQCRDVNSAKWNRIQFSLCYWSHFAYADLWIHPITGLILNHKRIHTHTYIYIHTHSHLFSVGSRSRIGYNRYR